MKFSLQTTRHLVATVICMSLAACGNEEELRRIKSVSIGHSGKAPQKVYADATSQTAAMIGASTGLVGALIGGAIASVNASNGVRRWESVTGRHVGTLKQALNVSMQNELRQVRGWGTPIKGVADAHFDFSHLHYGVSHVGKQRFKVVIGAQAKLRNASGKEFWKGHGAGTSMSSWTLEEFQANPRLFEEALSQAAQQTAATLARAIE